MDKKVDLKVVVNGTQVDVEANVNAPLHSIIGKALELSENVGQPPENWEFRNAKREVLDRNAKIETFAFADGTVIYLDLKVGVGG